jgi:hypothetical protein
VLLLLLLLLLLTEEGKCLHASHEQIDIFLNKLLKKTKEEEDFFYKIKVQKILLQKMLDHLEEANRQWNRPVPTLDPGDNQESGEDNTNGKLYSCDLILMMMKITEY